MERYIFKFFKKEPLWEMSNIFPKNTGLKYTIWIFTKSGREKHGARIKVIHSDWEISINISDNPEIKRKKGKVNIKSKDLHKIYKFIEINKNVLLDHWNGIIDTVDMIKKLKKV